MGAIGLWVKWLFFFLPTKLSWKACKKEEGKKEGGRRRRKGGRERVKREGRKEGQKEGKEGRREGRKERERKKETKKEKKEKMYEAYQELCQVSGFWNLNCMNATPLKVRCTGRTIWLGYGIVNLAKKSDCLSSIIWRVSARLCHTPRKLWGVGLIQSFWVGKGWMFLTAEVLAKSVVPELAVRRCCLHFGFLFFNILLSWKGTNHYKPKCLHI